MGRRMNPAWWLLVPGIGFPIALIVERHQLAADRAEREEERLRENESLRRQGKPSGSRPSTI